MKKMNEKGFTLAELLIVVAIIAVLVAVAIPTFTNQLEKAREATDIANLRSAYAEIVTKALENPQEAVTLTVNLKQSQKGWQTSSVEIAGTSIKEATGETNIPKANGTLNVVYTTASEDAPASITIAGVTITGTFASDNSNNKEFGVSIANVAATGWTNKIANLDVTLTNGEDGTAYSFSGITVKNGETTVENHGLSFDYNSGNPTLTFNDTTGTDIQVSVTYTVTVTVTQGENSKTATFSVITPDSWS